MAIAGWGLHFLVVMSPVLLSVGVVALVWYIRRRRKSSGQQGKGLFHLM